MRTISTCSDGYCVFHFAPYNGDFFLFVMSDPSSLILTLTVLTRTVIVICFAKDIKSLLL